MFDSTDHPRVFMTEPGDDFVDVLVKGIEEKLANAPMQDWPKVEIYLNTQRVRRKVLDRFHKGPARLLPRIRLITEFLHDPTLTHGQAPTPALQQRLEISQLVRQLLQADPRFGPASAAFDLAGSLVALFDEIHGEGLPSDTLQTLDVDDQSGHWERALRFVNLVQNYFKDDTHISQEALQRFAVGALIKRWETNPPQNPVIVAGSTGSRQTTFDLMCAVSKLPQGALILPGFDKHTPDVIWDELNNPDKISQDHPQYRYARLLGVLDVDPSAVLPWHTSEGAMDARNRLLSLSLRPAPVTHHWFSEGPLLTDIQHACEGITWVEAPDQKTESLTIALKLREMAELGNTAAVITPDRNLTRRISANLTRWGIKADDSAGMPLSLSPPGRFLMHLTETNNDHLTTETILTILKHPISHSGSDRGPHLRHSRELELYLRQNGPPFLDTEVMVEWSKKDDARINWTRWVSTTVFQTWPKGLHSLSIWLDHHLEMATKISKGPEGVEGELWKKAAGRELEGVLKDLHDHTDSAGDISFTDYRAILAGILSAGTVRELDDPHPNILIWGALEARVQSADLVILAGLNEGSWPEPPSPDPWLNRSMRRAAGLLLPDRRIGLAAHDYQQAMGAPNIWVTRSTKSDDAETVPSRWLNRLENLLAGLTTQDGPSALKVMKQKGRDAIALAQVLDRATTTASTPRPAPCPPPNVRPSKLSVTDIKTLVRDPYAIYAKHVLNLRRLDTMVKDPDARLTGIVIHEILSEFLKRGVPAQKSDAKAQLMLVADIVLAQEVPWPAVRRSWRAKVARFADWLITRELERQKPIASTHTEIKGEVYIPDVGTTVHGRADRIDIMQDGTSAIYDYKTGSPPTKDQQLHFDKQLLIEVEMLRRGGFGDLQPKHVTGATYIGLGTSPKEVAAPLDEVDVWAEFLTLLRNYQDPDQGYAARRALATTDFPSDYDQLSRFGEWDLTQRAKKQVVS